MLRFLFKTLLGITNGSVIHVFRQVAEECIYNDNTRCWCVDHTGPRSECLRSIRTAINVTNRNMDSGPRVRREYLVMLAAAAIAEAARLDRQISHDKYTKGTSSASL